MAKNKTTERWIEAISVLKDQKIFSTDVELAKQVDGLTKQIIRNIRAGDNGIKVEMLEAFFEAFPQVNARYILTGNGDLFVSGDGNREVSSNDKIENKMRKLYEVLLRDSRDELDLCKAEYEIKIKGLEERISSLKSCINQNIGRIDVDTDKGKEKEINQRGIAV